MTRKRMMMTKREIRKRMNQMMLKASKNKMKKMKMKNSVMMKLTMTKKRVMWMIIIV